MNFSIILTTIFLPKILEQFAKNFTRYGRKDEVEILIIGDLRSPAEIEDYVRGFERKGFHFEYWDVKKQEKWLERFPDLAKEIPYNSDNRRNIGHLIAYERGRRFLVTVDDDNFPTDEDYLQGYASLGETKTRKTVRSNTGWYNVCELLKTKEKIKFYPRGYPYDYRWRSDEKYSFTKRNGRLVVKAGLWLGDPDVDAVTRFCHPIDVLGIRETELVLAPETYCPFNTQNTAFHREVLPSYYYVLMGATIDGLKIDRYGDIWASYFSRKVIDHMGDQVAFGTPLVRQVRNRHDLFKDLASELPGMRLTNHLIRWLAQIQLTASGYSESTVELSRQLESKIEGDQNLPNESRVYFKKICSNLRLWVDVCKSLQCDENILHPGTRQNP